MGDFDLIGIFERFQDRLWGQGLEPAESEGPDPIDWECRRFERAQQESYYLGRPRHFFQDSSFLERCHARKEAQPVEALDAVKDTPLLEKAWNGLESLGLGIQRYAVRGFEYWKDPPDMGGQIFKMMLIYALGGGTSRADEAELHKNKRGEIRGTLHFRGEDYEVKTQGNRIIVNGRAWKFEGSTAKTRAASITVEELSFNERDESLKLEIKGSLAFFEEKVSKTLQGDQVERLLQALANSSDTVATPEMEAKGIRLIPADIT